MKHTIIKYTAFLLLIASISCSKKNTDIDNPANGGSGAGGGTTVSDTTRFVEIRVAASSVAALKSDGSLWTWGGSDYSHGQGNIGKTNIPKKVTQNVKDFFLSSGNLMVIKEDLTLWGCGRNIFPTSVIYSGSASFPSSCSLYAFGTYNDFFSMLLNNGSDTYSLSQISSEANWNKFSSNNVEPLAVPIIFKTNNYFYTWGYNLFSYGCAWWQRPASCGTGGAWLGSPGPYPLHNPTKVNNDSDWKEVVNRGYGMKNNGTLWYWALGHSTQNINPNIPIVVNTISDCKKIITDNFNFNGAAAMLIQKNDGTIWSVTPQTIYGTANNTYNFNTIQISNIPWKTMVYTSTTAVNSQRFIGIKQDGTLWARGYNQDGFLGDGTYIDKPNFIQIGTKSNWEKISGYRESYNLLDANGDIYAWGKNDQGQLGDSTYTDRYVPKLILKSKP